MTEEQNVTLYPLPLFEIINLKNKNKTAKMLLIMGVGCCSGEQCTQHAYIQRAVLCAAILDL